MATKAKENSVVGKEKKVTSSNSHITTTKRTTKPSTATTTTSTTTTTSSIKKPNSTSLAEKNTPNYLKPTLTSRHEVPSSKQPKTNSPNNKPSEIRRRSMDKPRTSSNLTRTASRRSSIGPLAKTTIPSKPISDRTSKAPSDGKTRPPLLTKVPKKTTPTTSTATSTSTRKVVANRDHGSVKSTKCILRKTAKPVSVETEQVIKEVTSQESEVIKVENEARKVHEVEHVVDISPDVESAHEIENVHGLQNSGPSHYLVDDDERVISTVPEAEKESLEEKAKDAEHEVEEDKENQDEGGNKENESEGEVVVSDAGKSESEGEGEGEGESRIIVMEDHRSENNNNNEGEAVEEGKVVEKVEEAKGEATPSKQSLEERKNGKKEAQIFNDVIEETTSKLMEARKNKVRAMAGAFQTVIDHQATSI
ncbi:unnamed protein product [Sphenostylis stenocarpa]|uniref:Calmodulin-binding domain-containing protein n=1 Tax=Sphenostylis stenocarpa TaxID=92480 RepID=A0AA86VNY3_9FABA|nr:unnamed protein product [Sphenostylis stenocarpa]